MFYFGHFEFSAEMLIIMIGHLMKMLETVNYISNKNE